MEVYALRAVDLDLYRGEFVVLLGPCRDGVRIAVYGARAREFALPGIGLANSRFREWAPLPRG